MASATRAQILRAALRMTIRLACRQRVVLFSEHPSTGSIHNVLYPPTPEPRHFAKRTQDEDRENAVDLPLSTLHPSQGMLISLELWNSFSETILEKMPNLKPKKLFCPSEIQTAAQLAMYVCRFGSLSSHLGCRTPSKTVSNVI